VLATLLVRALAARGLGVAAFKPLCSGARADARALHAALQGSLPLDVINPWYFRRSIAPLLAARAERRVLHLPQVVRHIRLAGRGFDFAVVEGAGGLLSPLGERFDSRDLLLALRGTALIACPNRLGAVNQARLALEALPGTAATRAVVVLMNGRRRDGVAASNPRLLAEFHPADRMVVMPWVGNWRRPAALRRPEVQRALNALTRLAGA
jgi:dethiobiotin synthetase